MIQTMDYERFRQQLAGLASTDAAEFDAETFRQFGIRLGVVMAELFGESLDRLTLWQRISDGIRTSSAKVGDGDTDHFLSLCLEFIKADDARAAANQHWTELLIELGQQDDGFRRLWIRYLNTRVFAVVAHARAAWEGIKVDKASAKASQPTAGRAV